MVLYAMMQEYSTPRILEAVVLDESPQMAVIPEKEKRRAEFQL